MAEMSPLRRRMIEDMTVRNLSPATQRSYIYAVTKFSRYFKRSPDKLGLEDVRAFQVFLVSTGISWPALNQTVCALRFFYGVTLGRGEMPERIAYAREPRKLPVVLNADELVRFFEAVPSLKARTALTTAYAAGLRASEAVGLKVGDIDSGRMVIRVEHGKGGKDRYVMLSAQLLGILRTYWRLARPRTAAETLRAIAADPKHLGAEIGLVAVLHTWGQNLHHHPHVHCVVPGGGPSLDGTHWVACRPGLPVRVLSRLFRRLFIDELRAAFEARHLGFFGDLAGLAQPAAFARRLRDLLRVEWVVYAKPPFGGPAQVLAYLGRYTHRVAISNARLVNVTDEHVAFRWKDYRHDGKTKVMTLEPFEFIRRFLLHALPDGFHRIRHYGFLANGHRTAKLAFCRSLLDMPSPSAEQVEDVGPPRAPERCPCCGGVMIVLGILPRPAPVPRCFLDDTS
jgi:site-specific recombinase XerC